MPIPSDLLVHAFLVGLLILIGAVVINIMAAWLGVTTWYPFLDAVRDRGLGAALSKENVSSLIFLFGMYPLLLGAIAVGASLLLKK